MGWGALSYQTSPASWDGRRSFLSSAEYLFCSYLDFLSRTFTIHGTASEGGGYLFNSPLPHPPASQTLGHYPGDYGRVLTSAYNWQLDSNRESLVSERKSVTTKLRAINTFIRNMEYVEYLHKTYLFMSLNLGEGQIFWTDKMIKGNLPLVITFSNLSGSVLYQRIHHLFLYA